MQKGDAQRIIQVDILSFRRSKDLLASYAYLIDEAENQGAADVADGLRQNLLKLEKLLERLSSVPTSETVSSSRRESASSGAR